MCNGNQIPIPLEARTNAYMVSGAPGPIQDFHFLYRRETALAVGPARPGRDTPLSESI